MAKIQDGWGSVLEAFLQRELSDYRYLDGELRGYTKEERQSYALDSWREEIEQKVSSVVAADKLILQSMTNMGLVHGEIQIPLTPFEPGVYIQMNLGSSPPQPRKK